MPVTAALGAPGTAEPFVSGISPLNPTARFFSRVDFKNLGPGIAYIGVQLPGGVSSSVSATAYDITLAVGDSKMVGWGDDVYVDMGATWRDSDTGGNQVVWTPETY